jgi:hypothetical protein
LPEKLLLQLGQGQVRLMTQPIAQSLPHRLRKLGLAARPVGHALHLPGAQLLAANLLHIAQTDTETLRQLRFRPFALPISFQDSETQIICVRFRHGLIVAGIAKTNLSPNLPLHY